MYALPLVVITDLLIFNASFILFKELGWNLTSKSGLLICNLLYIISLMCFKPVAHKRFTSIEQVVRRSFMTCIFYQFIFVLLINLSNGRFLRPKHYIAFAIIATILLIIGRIASRQVIRMARQGGRNSRKIVFIGGGKNLEYLYSCLQNHMAKGFIFMGYFCDHVSTSLPAGSKLLGDVKDVLPWLEANRPQCLYCNLPSTQSEEIRQIMNYCETHFIRFYAVPNVRDFVQRTMTVEMIDDMPVLSLLHDPLRKQYNVLLKRSMDIIISGLFIVTCFWWIYIIVAIITKLTMPGPVFFCQKRNGLLGKEFNMIKFRSMKVNSQADTLQATKNDPRKTKWGNIMRKTNIDELPQFINVLLGDMSVVGPRPHMVKHTEEYSSLIDKYMVRHWVKPGITGWAQVTGARGETEELWQMEERIKKDIWYIDHWSLWLDLHIIFKTVWNVIAGDKQAY